MNNESTYENLLQLIKEIRTEPNSEYKFAMPEWFVDEHRDWFVFKNDEVYFHGGKVFVYPNEFKC